MAAVPGRRVSITDVAREAKVSVTTVSHVLSGRRPVAEATKARVHQVIDDLGYVPNEIARSMRSRRTNAIGFVIPDITNPFFPALVRGALDVLTPQGVVGIVCDTGGDRGVEEAVIGQLVRRQVDALAVASGRSDNDGLEPAVDAGIPVAHLGGDETAAGVDVLVTDDADGGAQIAAHLVDRGYRRIAFALREGQHGPPDQRLAGFLAGLAKRDPAAEPLVVRLSSTSDGGLRGLDVLFEGPDRPDAIACVNDVVALKVLGEAQRRGLSVPGDVAVTGFDDIQAATLVSPMLTTVSHGVREMGMLVARMLLERLDPEAEKHAPRKVVVPASLVLRGSS